MAKVPQHQTLKGDRNFKQFIFGSSGQIPGWETSLLLLGSRCLSIDCSLSVNCHNYWRNIMKCFRFLLSPVLNSVFKDRKLSLLYYLTCSSGVGEKYIYAFT